MKKFSYKMKGLIPAIVTAITLSACNKAENYFEKLDIQPEIRTDYQSVYGVGDTLILEGRLNPEKNLEIHIGGMKAEISSITRFPRAAGSIRIEGDSLDRARIVIREEMGIGTDRPVTVTSAGITIQCPAIEIIEGINNGYLPHPVQLVRHAGFSAGYVPLFCQNGKGTVYYWNRDQRITRIDKDGSNTIVLEAGALSDAHGNFTVTTFNAGGVDQQEHNLYFSAITTDGHADNNGNQVYRFCRYDLQTRQLTTLNRSLYPATASQRIWDAFTPFEGSIVTTRLFAADGIYPAGNGHIFIHIPQSSTVARLDASGELTYLFRLGPSVPPVYNPATGANYSTVQIRLMLPGTTISTRFSSIRGVLPDENILYANTASAVSNITQIDLANSVQTYNFTPPYVQSFQDAVITGSFNILTYNASASLGYLPLPDARILALYYPGTDNARYPAFATLSFREEAGRRYAPGTLARNGYNLTGNGQMLNYDEEGMIYMTANNNTMIVKTANQ